MNRAVEFVRKLFQVVNIERVILIRVEARTAVMAPLDKMQWKARYSQACTSGHGVGKRIASS